MRLVCEHISKTFVTKGRVLNVLEDVTVEAADHDFVCIFGPNGCGKSTLLRILAGVLAPSGGRVFFKDGGNAPFPVSLIFQEHGLFPWLTVRDNACFNLEMRGFSRKERYAKAQGLIEEMGLARFVDYYPGQLSTGMKQKVNLIRGLLMDSPILLIDEADKSLDVYSKLVVQKDIHRIWSQYRKTIIYVTHDIEGALGLAKTIWIMGHAPTRIIKTFDVDGDREELKRRIMEILEQEAYKMTL